MPFFIRNLKQEERLGEKIRALRKHKNITLSEVVKRTKIQKKYLEAFETGRYDQLPEPIYAKNFLKKFLLAIGGDPDYFVARFEEEIKKCDLLAPHRLPAKRTGRTAFFVSYYWWKILLGLALAGIIIGYLTWQAVALLAPPNITVLTPPDGLETTEAIIEITGSVDREAEIFINGIPAIPDANKNFISKITLERGLNVITIEAKTRHSKKAAVYRKVVLKQE